MIAITDKKKCCGCSACVQICPVGCITFAEDAEGFLYPTVDALKCRQCGLCDSVCPCLNQREKSAPLHTYAAVNHDEEVRGRSSSGGVFTPLAENILREGGVVFGARFDRDWNVEHVGTESADGIVKMQGSKYAQSNMGDCYALVKKHLKDGRRVLFTGTACQVAGLRNFLGCEYDNLLAVDIVCHGVPSPKIWKMWLNEKAGAASITNISFRDKRQGWKRYSLVIESGEGEVIYQSPGYKTMFMRGFLKDLYTRPSCSRCPAKGFAAGSDLTIADYWGIGDVLPEMDDDRGCSLVFANTEKGLDAFRSLGIRHMETEYRSAISGNRYIENSARPSPNRKKFYRAIGTVALDDLISKYTRNTLASKVRNKIRKYIR